MTIPLESVLEDTGTKLVIIPQMLIDKLNAALDAAYANAPEAAKGERDIHYNQLLAFVDQYGYVPEFSINKAAMGEDV